MDNGSKKLFPIVLLVSALSLVGGVLVFAGVPMAGATSTIICAVIATVLTLLMAFALSHEPGAGH
jgi:amino acid transporter